MDAKAKALHAKLCAILEEIDEEMPGAQDCELSIISAIDALEEGEHIWNRHMKTKLSMSSWPSITWVAEQLGCAPSKVCRLLDNGELLDNHRKRKKRRIDPASLMYYVVQKGAKFNCGAD